MRTVDAPDTSVRQPPASPDRLPPAADRCAWLKSKGYGVPDVRRDRHGLDRSKDGRACGKGDFRERR